MSGNKPKIPWDEDDQGWDQPAALESPDPPWPGVDMDSSAWVVLKFGGTSMSGAANAATIADVLRRCVQDGERPLVVCSALSGVTSALERLLIEAESGDGLGTLAWIRQRHEDQAMALGVQLDPMALEFLKDLERFVKGVSLLGEVSPRLRARTLSAGELLSTRLLASYLQASGLDLRWMDARDLLTSTEENQLERRYLSAQVPWARDPALADMEGSDILLTQGFIARDPSGDTVLLGRGGSDTSAAIFAARVGAGRLEIWTDVPGMFTANPRDVPSARLLRSLDYDEAQELATTGAKVLHPRCIAPVREAGIPLHIRNTTAPEQQGTVIASDSASGVAQVKAVSSRTGITLVVMDTLGMWQQVGFLADAFAIFKKHGVSIDLVATSESNVSVTLDSAANTLAPGTLDRLMADLSTVCTPKIIRGAAQVSLVGRRIRAILHKLGPVFERFEDQRVHLMSQAASDLNLSFVIPEEQAGALVSTLHKRLFARAKVDDVFGPAWSELTSPVESVQPPWWRNKAELLLEQAALGTPAYLYDTQTLDSQAQRLLDLPVDRVLFAIKANPHPEILRRFYDAGLGFECVSPGELDRVKALFGDLGPERLLFTPNFAPKEDYEAGFSAGARVTLDSVAPLRQWPEVFRGKEIFVRLDPGRGDGHHRFVVTAGAQSKFGVPPAEVEELIKLCSANEVRVVGLHAHAGSGIHDVSAWADKASFLAQLAQSFPDVRVLDLGGGLGVPERSGAPGLDMVALAKVLRAVKSAHPQYEIWLEPGRFLVAQAGVLLGSVTQVKDKGARLYVGVDAGMHTLIRPALYGAWHEIVNLSRLDQVGAIRADVVGPICETGDVLGHDRRLPDTQSGDVLLVGNAGAYGASMSSDYNLRPRAREALLP